MRQFRSEFYYVGRNTNSLINPKPYRRLARSGITRVSRSPSWRVTIVLPRESYVSLYVVQVSVYTRKKMRNEIIGETLTIYDVGRSQPEDDLCSF